MATDLSKTELTMKQVSSTRYPSDHEKALSVFEKYELELFFKLKADGIIHGSTIKKVRKAIELSGVSRQFTEQFIHHQIQDMRQQLEEQGFDENW